ncbi:hypothetical protein C5467_19610 [Photorhabdus khanii subsp. guanajuatensis]|uniref:Uncharacterized protein n=1 Tax=Photorhabdus khanii subsp. guanajuatensis TaxID=2100166 RepID=A0A4R4J4M3_9GAMM|nr:hypothetical protein C5467_19610 [Photorhabdus khanii subsp. guanajuatensis]
MRSPKENPVEEYINKKYQDNNKIQAHPKVKRLLDWLKLTAKSDYCNWLVLHTFLYMILVIIII